MVAVMLSLARSRYILPTQIVFLATNALGLVLGTVYNARTPDLYPNNAHHKIGWLGIAVVSAQALTSIVGWLAEASSRPRKQLSRDSHDFMPVPHEVPRQDNGYRAYPEYRTASPYRLSDDSDQNTEFNPASFQSSSASTLHDHDDADDVPLDSPYKEYQEENGELQAMPLSWNASQGILARNASKFVALRVWKYLDIGRRIIDRIILPFGFIVLATGIATFGRFFVSRCIFGLRSLAHVRCLRVPNRRGGPSSTALLTGSKEACSSGSVSSL